ncbi:MAG TPA: dihydrolipoamide acyltransferase [Acidimicrobiaceae bacterium]|jgi:pyruvate/2-oxoglutarate dehydrogenase complex dihydrolipoamide acyltransferase (E2) component|nr:dihydrolipoamide acyltransferase [bacterium AH-315-A03]HBL07932.1 dihydrolipoamide acyltransferase [Acidimicrobiaceae bacterium]HIM84476.1 dihydrolipoamide acyltransferase [Acidimicrobiia bacterium]
METVPILVPQMGVVEEVFVVEWLVEDGQSVLAGQPVVVIESEKAEVEVEAGAAGVIEVIVVPGEEPVPVGTLLGSVVVQA